jgi:hypothetical protein
MDQQQSRGPTPIVRGIAVIRRPDGLIRYDAPDGTTRYITDEEWAEICRKNESEWPEVPEDWKTRKLI